MDPIFFDKKTCGTCRKAQAYLDENKVAFTMVDILSDPPDKEMLEKFIDEKNIKVYLNSRSALYRQHQMSQKLPDKATAIKLMLEDPNLIKRPFIVQDNTGSFGFDPYEFQDKWVK